jgi:hypothetical protein
VLVVEVDVIGAETSQRPFYRGADARRAAVIAPNPMRETSSSLNLMYFMVTIEPGLSPSREGLLIGVMAMPPRACGGETTSPKRSTATPTSLRMSGRGQADPPDPASPPSSPGA